MQSYALSYKQYACTNKKGHYIIERLTMPQNDCSCCNI